MRDLARLLLETRRAANPGTVLDDAALAGVAMPTSPAEAYAVQAAVAAETGPVGGWKVGRPAPDADATFAPIFTADIVANPYHPPSLPCSDLGLECEIAFELATDLPGRAEAYTRAEVEAAIATARPVVELVWSRLEARDRAPPLLKLADNGINGGLVLGAPIADWRSRGFDDLDITLVAGDRTIKTRRGPNPGGDPVDLLRALADLCKDHCGGLRRGQIVTTGSYTGLDFVGAPERIEAVFAGIETLRIEIG
ncbi:MAG: fumarylacetoacetate hydrolase family protein [Geminicoccaceae bacterium]|nr:fumarylacetoacetate hydrolase family protein [Geminicoccaceae bacterium]